MEIAIEKENLVLDCNLRPVHKMAGEMPDGIELDFADHQIELITEPFKKSKEVIEQIETFMADSEFDNSYFWPMSIPKTNQAEATILGTRTETEQKYRQLLLNRYGLDKMLVSGIHINYSNCKEEPGCNHENHYFELMKRAYVFGPILSQFVSFTPYTYQNELGTLDKIGQNYGKDGLISLRNSDEYGYGNEHLLDLDYTNYHTYRDSVKRMIIEGRIDSEKELYAKVRHKGTHIELRFIDLNPYERAGITANMLDLFAGALDAFTNIDLVDFNQKQNIANFDLVATKGINHQLELTINGQTKILEEHTMDLLDLVIEYNNMTDEQLELIENLRRDYLNNNLPINKMLNEFKENDYTTNEFGLRHLKHQTEYQIIAPELKMELSTKILINEAKEHQIKVNIIDETSNFIELDNGLKKELVVQATKTNLDSYANVLAMENKYVTKHILENAQISVPKGIKINNIKQVDYKLFDTKMVIKPLDTNFGQGITILEPNAVREDIDSAINFAFGFSDTVIIEEFASGIEYRFLVIGGETVSIVNRVAANVICDGVHTIKELLCFKNSNTIRNKGYITPVEYLTCGEFEKKYLEDQNLTWDSILEKGHQVFLRENSNVSTGGDSYEVYDDIPAYFKQEAAKAAKALNVEICGIDMIIDDLNSEEYQIIEANFNPAIQMHTYPFSGTGKNVASKILKALNLI